MNKRDIDQMQWDSIKNFSNFDIKSDSDTWRAGNITFRSNADKIWCLNQISRLLFICFANRCYNFVTCWNFVCTRVSMCISTRFPYWWNVEQWEENLSYFTNLQCFTNHFVYTIFYKNNVLYYTYECKVGYVI